MFSFFKNPDYLGREAEHFGSSLLVLSFYHNTEKKSKATTAACKPPQIRAAS
jgi:hypothetical protein